MATPFVGSLTYFFLPQVEVVIWYYNILVYQRLGATCRPEESDSYWTKAAPPGGATAAPANPFAGS